jgi:hypothetical protein
MSEGWQRSSKTTRVSIDSFLAIMVFDFSHLLDWLQLICSIRMMDNALAGSLSALLLLFSCWKIEGRRAI